MAKDKNTKIDVNQVKDFHSSDAFIKQMTDLETAIRMEHVKILESILSKDLPPERYTGILNLFYVFINRNATTEEIESALVNSDSMYTSVTFSEYIL